MIGAVFKYKQAVLKPIFDSNPQSSFLTPRSGKIGVIHATFGYGRPPRSVGPLGLAVEIVSIAHGPVPHRIWGPGAGATYPSHHLGNFVNKRQTDVTPSFPTTAAQPLFGKAAEAATS